MKNKDWKKCIIPADSDVREAVRILNEGAMQIGLVVDADHKLLGVLTDGDFRRAILLGVLVTDPVLTIMNKNPTVVFLGDSKEKASHLMKAKQIHQIPVVDESGRVHNIYTIDNLYPEETFDNEIVLMVGGLGSRLKNLTKDCPKPLLKVGGRPLLETIILKLKEQGFYKFVFCVNYLSDQLKNYFADGSQFGLQIRYVEENKRLGTAGALRLADLDFKKTAIVMNGDILTNLDFKHFLQFHKDGDFTATMAVRRIESQIPYGVIQINQTQVVSMVEKPIQPYLINAGIYCFNPQAFEQIPQDQYYDMNQFISALLAVDKKIGAFPINEYWIDIGKMEDYERANLEFQNHFKID